jgi:nuclear pore complex protein Nup205
MSFLIRLGESRHGAERLLESRVLPILAQVDFLDSRPELDEGYTGKLYCYARELLS